MSAIAVFMMLLTIVLIWGGLVASVVLLRVLPEPDGEAIEHLYDDDFLDRE
ncbi:methionine/alanine import family NSS transporter small subunit [Actinomyces culturomici]|uniref:methionine/alanine import family NSS transporter small subunit n=1 Tax=Actinomyces culturomici TaxID=1926276 RepID=UPI000E20AB86|nr:methionine/alanine import family NSS transporter small subunit [Actinomyces culturomici]